MKKYNWFLVFGVIGLTTLGQPAFTTEDPAAAKPAPAAPAAAKPSLAAAPATTAKPAAAKPSAAPTARPAPAAEVAAKPAPAAKPPAAEPAPTAKPTGEDSADKAPAAKPPTLYVDDASACKGKSRPCSLTPTAWMALKPELQTMAFMHAVQGPKDRAPLPLRDRALFLIYLSEKAQGGAAVGNLLASREKESLGFVAYVLAELESDQAALLLLDLRSSICAGPVSDTANARVTLFPSEIDNIMKGLMSPFQQEIIEALDERNKPFADDLRNKFPAPAPASKRKRSGA